MLADEVGRQTLACIRCSACLNVCPVYERTGGHAYESVYPGPIGAILTPQLRGVDERRLAAVRLEPLRRLLRGLPRQDRHPARCWSISAAGSSPRRRRSRGERLAMRALAWVFAGERRFRLRAAHRPAGAASLRARRTHPAPARGSGRLDARRATCRPVARQTFRDWWASR